MHLAKQVCPVQGVDHLNVVGECSPLSAPIELVSGGDSQLFQHVADQQLGMVNVTEGVMMLLTWKAGLAPTSRVMGKLTRLTS